MSTSPVRISLVGAVLAAALSLTGCGDSSETVDTGISNFASNSDQMQQSAWNMPTNLVNSYSEVDTETRTLNTHMDGLDTASADPYQYDFYTSFRKIAAEGDNGQPDQTIGAVQVDGFNDGTYALGRDGAIYVENDEWEVAFPAGIELNDTWVTDTDAYVPYAHYYYSNAVDLDSSNSSSPSAYFEYQYVSGNSSTTYSENTDLVGITVAKITESNATMGTYTGLTKIVYTTTYRPYSLPANSTVIGLDQFSVVETLYWKPGIGMVSNVYAETAPNYIQSATNPNRYTVGGTTVNTYTYTLTSSSTPSTNG